MVTELTWKGAEMGEIDHYKSSGLIKKPNPCNPWKEKRWVDWIWNTKRQWLEDLPNGRNGEEWRCADKESQKLGFKHVKV